VLTKEAHHKGHSLVGFIAGAFKRCASFVSTSYGDQDQGARNPFECTYAKYAAFFEIAQALILNFLQSRRIATFYEIINV